MNILQPSEKTAGKKSQKLTLGIKIWPKKNLGGIISIFMFPIATALKN